MTTKIPPTLEKEIGTYFRERSGRERVVRYELLDAGESPISQVLSAALRKRVDCYFLKRKVDGRDTITLCPAATVFDVLTDVIKNLDVASFMSYEGSLSITADKSQSGNLEIHLVGWGLQSAVIE
jgi:hypothetical protein